MKLKGRVAIITGASRGIGSAIARRFVSEGAKVVVNYNSSENLALELVDELRKNGSEAIAIKADVSKQDEVKQLVKKTLDAFGRVDILVNNAGVLFEKTFLDAPQNAWDQTIDVNLKGAYLCSKEVAPIMLTQKKGKIINISSISGLNQPSAMTNVEYVASKAGMNGLTKALAFKLGPSVNVNAICPGWIKTEMVADTDPEVEKKILEETAVKRFGTPDEVANAALYLASDETNYVTGELHIVAGGRGMH